MLFKIFGTKRCLLLGGILLGILSGCNKEFKSKLDFDKNINPPGIKGTSYKVAYIVLEGGVGEIIGREATEFGKMPTLGTLAQHAQLSWNSVSAPNKEVLTSYADLLTGVELAKHKVAGAGQTHNLVKYPTLFKRIAQKTAMKTAFVSANTDLGALIDAKDVSSYSIVGSDEEVTDQAVTQLQTDDIGFLMATFKDVDGVGKADGYNSNSYKDALRVFDGQLDRLIQTIASRKDYVKEKWMVVVTSTKGGKYTLPAGQNDGSVFSDTERNNFVVISNVDFASRLFQRPSIADPVWVGSATRFTDASGESERGRGVLASDLAKFFNMVEAKDYTIQLKVKIHQLGSHNPPLISNRVGSNGGEQGWTITLRGAGGTGNPSSKGFIARYNGTACDIDAPLEVGKWYTVTWRVWRSGSQKKMTLYVDGVAGGEVNISGDAKTDLPLIIGNPPSDARGEYDKKRLSYSLADIRFYDTGWTTEHIKQYYCSTLSTTATDPYRSNLIGYWLGNDVGGELKDHSNRKEEERRHFKLYGSYKWEEYSERRSSTLCPTLRDNLEQTMPRSVDIPRSIYAWFNFMDISSYDLDSQAWNPTMKTP